MQQLDPDGTLFDKVLHRDMHPKSVKNGKDLSLITERMDRAILFDDKVKNFLPQGGKNGIHIKKYSKVGENDFGEMPNSQEKWREDDK